MVIGKLIRRKWVFVSFVGGILIATMARDIAQIHTAQMNIISAVNAAITWFMGRMG